jgi:type I restriction enzyme S subunit
VTAPAGWQIKPLSKVVSIQRGFDLPHQARRPGHFPVLTAGETGGFHDQGPVRGPGVTIGRATNLGQPKWSEGDFWPHNTTMFVKDFLGNLPRWVFHFFENTDLAGYDSGSVQPMLNRNYIAQVPVLVPPIEEQRAISEVLGAIDDKIAANTRLVALLDSHMALEYTASLADGGIETPLDDVAQFHNRRRVPLSAREREQRPGSVPYYGASGVFGTVDEALFNEQLVLVGEDGSVINANGTPVVQYIWGPAWVNNHAHVLTGIGLSTEVLFQAIARAQVATLVTGAVQPKINMGNLKSLLLELPGEAYMSRLQSVIGAETAIKRAVTEENRSLAATRDALLPQLMSGRLRVKAAVKVLEVAGV